MALPQIGLRLQVESHIPIRTVLFIIYINDIDVGFNNFISKFVDDTEIVNSIITDHDRISLQEDLRKISEWSKKL